MLRAGLQEALSSVDVLIAFAAFTETTIGNTCRPLVLPAISQGGSSAVLELKGLWNPCAVSPDGGCIVPNDLTLGSRCPIPVSHLHSGGTSCGIS